MNSEGELVLSAWRKLYPVNKSDHSLQFQTLLLITFFPAFEVRIFYNDSDSPVKMIHEANGEKNFLFFSGVNNICHFWSVLISSLCFFACLFWVVWGFFTLNVGFSVYLVNEQKFTFAFHRIWKRGIQKNGIVFGVI